MFDQQQAVLGSPLAGAVILAAEDEFLIGCDLERTLTDCGAEVELALTVTEALSRLERPDLSAALLDIRLGNETVERVCEALDARGIPFAFMTGYPAAPFKRWTSAPILHKPFVPAQVIEALRQIIRAS